MNDTVPSIISHLSIGTNRFNEAVAFYDKVLTTVSARRIMEHGEAVAYGKHFPEFWVQTPINGEPAETGNGIHVSFLAEDREQVDEFFRVALECGATDDGAPGWRPEYGVAYYGCFVRDLDGHKIEAMFWDEQRAGQDEEQ